MVEVGIPFSDPMADGPVIQDAATKALKNGMSLGKIFAQLKAVKDEISIPLVLMGYLNPIMQYGIERFCRSCVESGVAGAIIPDLPFKDYLETIKPVADRHGVRIIMLITPETSDERIRFIDEHTDGFIYMVSSAATTGAQKLFDEKKQEYFRRINAMGLRNPPHDRIRHIKPPDTRKLTGKRRRGNHRKQVRNLAQREPQCRRSARPAVRSAEQVALRSGPPPPYRLRQAR